MVGILLLTIYEAAVLILCYEYDKNLYQIFRKGNPRLPIAGID